MQTARDSVTASPSNGPPEHASIRRRQRCQTLPMFDSSFLQAEKEPDDLDAPDPRRPLYHSQRSAHGAVSSLFVRQPSGLTSRQTSYNNKISSNERMRVASVNTLTRHLHTRGLLEGRHSDITVIAFGTNYPLHRLLLDRAPFFASALTPPWLEASAKEITLQPEDADPNITKASFELALRHLYGSSDPDDEKADPFATLATACWLEMQDLIDDSVDSILRSLNSANLSHAVTKVTSSCYGKAGETILAAAQCILIREGTDLPSSYFDGFPADVVRDVVASDGFYVRNEYDRWLLASSILDRRLRTLSATMKLPTRAGKLRKAPKQLRSFPARLSTYFQGYSDADTESEGDAVEESRAWIDLYSHTDVEPILHLLDHDIHYVHLKFEQLQVIKASKDLFGFATVPERILMASLWSSLELRQKVVNARSNELNLNLSSTSGKRKSPTSFLTTTSPRTSTSQTGGSPASDSESNVTVWAGPDDSARDKFWIPTQDCSIPLGRYPLDLAAKNSQIQHSPSPKHFCQQPSPRDCAMDDTEHRPYSHLPPFRFAVQFDKSQHLPEKKRIYSQTFFYAGSYWNIYIQKQLPTSRSKNRTPRLGFYLHRTKGPDGEDGPINFVDERIHALERGMLRSDRLPPDYGATLSNDSRPRRSYTDSDGDPAFNHLIDRQGNSRPIAHPHRLPDMGESPSPPGLATFPDRPILGTQQPWISSANDNNAPIRTIPQYIDTRPTVRAYFKIHTITSNGRYMNVHQSVPDKFNFSQSWGWKSSTMMADEEWSSSNVPGASYFGGVGGSASDEESGFSHKLARVELDMPSEGGGEGGMDKERDLEGGVGASGASGAGNGSEGKLRFMVAVGLV